MIGAEFSCGENLRGKVAALLKLTVGWKFKIEFVEKNLRKTKPKEIFITLAVT